MQFLFWELELFIDLKYGIYSFDGSTRWPGCQWGVHRSAHPLHPMQNVESKILASCVFPSSSFDFCSSVHTVNANAPRDFCFGSKFYGNELLTGSFFLFFSGVLFITETRELSATHYSSYDLFGLMQNMYLQYYIKVKWYIGVRYMYEHYDIKVQYMYM